MTSLYYDFSDRADYLSDGLSLSNWSKNLSLLLFNVIRLGNYWITYFSSLIFLNPIWRWINLGIVFKALTIGIIYKLYKVITSSKRLLEISKVSTVLNVDRSSGKVCKRLPCNINLIDALS